MSSSKNRKCFTFNWTLENVSYCWQKSILSPTFVISSLQESKFQLELYPRGSMDDEFIGFYLHKLTCPPVEIECELALLSKHGSVLVSRKSKMPLNIAGCHNLKEIRQVFTTNRSIYPSEDKLTTRCTIWNLEEEMKEDVQCFSRTQIIIEKEVFLWKIRNFSSIGTEEKRTYQIKTVQDNKVVMTFELHLTNPYTDEDSITLQIICEISKVKYFTLHVMPVNECGSVHEGIKKEFCCENKKPKLFNLHFSRKDLIANKSVCLPNDVLSFRCECIFSTGDVFSKIESVIRDCEIVSVSEPDSRYFNENNLSKSRRILNDDLKSLLHNHIFSDIKLKTNSKTYFAHKNILSARSPVFKAMFDNDMKAKINEYVDIQDLDSDTVHQLLQYVYTAEIPVLQWENAFNLYQAADKYEILALRDECFAFLKSNLCPNTACDLLILADVHQDAELKYFVQDFIFSYDLVNSAKWEQLMETHLKLAADTMRLQIQRKTLKFPSNNKSTMSSEIGNSAARTFFTFPELSNCVTNKPFLQSFAFNRSSEKSLLKPLLSSNLKVEEEPLKLLLSFPNNRKMKPTKPSTSFCGSREKMPVKPSDSYSYQVPSESCFSFGSSYAPTSKVSSGFYNSVVKTPSTTHDLDNCVGSTTNASTDLPSAEIYSKVPVLNKPNSKLPSACVDFKTPYDYNPVSNPRIDGINEETSTSTEISRRKAVTASTPFCEFGNIGGEIFSTTSACIRINEFKRQLSSTSRFSTKEHGYLLPNRNNPKTSSALDCGNAKSKSAVVELDSSIGEKPTADKAVFSGRANIKEPFSSENHNFWYAYPRGYAADQLGFRKSGNANGNKHNREVRMKR